MKTTPVPNTYCVIHALIERIRNLLGFGRRVPSKECIRILS